MAFAARTRLTTTITTLPRLDPDVALVRQFRATGNPALFEALFRKYQSPIFHLVTRMVNGEDAYDLTQDVFLRALRALPTFKGDCKFRTWLYTIAKNTCMNHLRDSKIRADTEGYSLDEPVNGSDGDIAREIPDPSIDIANIVEVRELQHAVDKILARLTPEQRMLITLRDLQQLSYEEIAEIMDLSLVNVKSKLHRARTAFKTAFEPYLGLISPDLGTGTQTNRK